MTQKYEDKSWSIVDTHQHFQNLCDAEYPWLDPDRPQPLEGDLSAIRRNYMPADYLTDVAGLGIIKSVHVQNGRNPQDPLEETRWLSSLCEKDGVPNAIVAYADLSNPDIAQQLEAQAAFPLVRGIRQVLNWAEAPHLRSVVDPNLMDNTQWRRGFAHLEPLGMSFDLQLYWPQMSLALDLAKAYPQTSLILNHFGMIADRSGEGVAGWRSAIKALASAPNISVKLSGFGLGNPNWQIDDTQPILHHVLECFGPNRTMVGTNLPVDLLFASPQKIVDAIRVSVSDLSVDERVAVLRSNAERTYRI